MIASVKGVVETIAADHIVVDVGGVGYRLSGSARLLEACGPPGTRGHFFVETLMRENAIVLYGFASAEERDWFCRLIAVQGVGARLALAITGALSPQALFDAILYEDVAALTAAPGVGKRVAMRLVAELKDRLPARFDAGDPGSPGGSPSAARAIDDARASEAGRQLGDVIDALVSLGFQRAESGRVASALQREGDGTYSTPDLIKRALGELAK